MSAPSIHLSRRSVASIEEEAEYRFALVRTSDGAEVGLSRWLVRDLARRLRLIPDGRSV